MVVAMKKLVAIFICIFLISCADSVVDSRKRSEHFVDGKFVNRADVKFHSLWEMLWDGLTSDVERATWPKWLDTQEDRSPLTRVLGEDVRVTYINHATFLIQVGGVNILTDPVFSERTSPVSFIGPKRIHDPGIAFDNLPPIDVVIISHDHYDHLDLESINKLIKRDKPSVYMGLGVAERLKPSRHTVEMDWGESIQITNTFKLWFLEVQHFSGRTLTDRNSTLWGGFMLEVAGKKIYFGGDSGYGEHYKQAFEQFGAVDLAFIPIGAYAPRKFFKPIHLNPYEAVQAHKDLHAKFSIGMHYGTFQLSAEPFDEPLKLLEQAKQEASLDMGEFISLNIGVPSIYK